MNAYLAALLAAAGATLALMVALLLRYLPHSLIVKVGLACQMEDGCASPLPVWAGSTFSFLLGGMVLGLLLFAAVAVYGQVSCSSRKCLDVLLTASTFPGALPARLQGRVVVVDDDTPVSYTIGFLRPRVVVSTGLLTSLEHDEIQAVLAHEEGHVAARDTLVSLVGQTIALTFGPLPGVRSACALLRRAQERAADEYAAEKTGDGLLVASSLTKFARVLVRGSTPAPAAAFAESGDVGERVRGLLADGVVTSKRRLAAAVTILIVALASFSGSAVAFTGVTLASRSDCATCHSYAVADSAGAAVDLHDPCASQHPAH